MVLPKDDLQTLEITLTGGNNKTLKGVLNFTGLDLGGALGEEEEIYDSKGAATFVIVVILVYGLSIVLMIGSLAKKNMKVKDVDAEEKQIHRYLNQANDLREKGAKDNYRELKKNIILLVNKTPEMKNKMVDHTVKQDLSHNVLRSMMAVGSPTAAIVVQAGATKPGRQASESDSTHALLEIQEEGETEDAAFLPPHPPRPVTSQPATSRVVGPRDSIVTQVTSTPRARVTLIDSKNKKAPRDSVSSHVSPTEQHYPGRAMPQGERPPGRPQGQSIPRVVVSQSEEHDGRPPVKDGKPNLPLQPLDIQKAQNNQLSRMERDSKIYCDVDGKTLDDKKKCKLTMDSDGNIWIMQTSPDMSSSPRSHRRLPPSPSVSTPGSLGYDSLGESLRASHTPSPSSVINRTPSPAVGSLKTSTSYSPGASRRRSRSKSPSPQSPPKCCDPARPTALRAMPAVRVGYPASQPVRGSPADTVAQRREAQRSDVASPRRDVSTHPDYSHSRPSRHPSPPPDTDEEELVQITTV